MPTRVFAVVLAVACASAVLVAVPANAAPPGVARAEAVELYRDEYLPALTSVSGLDFRTDDCTVAGESASFDASLSELVNIIRNRAGLPSITWDEGLADEARAALLRVDANDSWTPAADDRCQPAAPSTANWVINANWGGQGAALLANRGEWLGNGRLTLLDAQLERVGYAASAGRSTLRATADFGPYSGPAYTMWPPSGWLADDWASDTWSFHANGTDAYDYSDAVVEVREDGELVPTTIVEREPSSGRDRLVWTFDDTAQVGADGEDREFTVDITGMRIGAATVDHSYSVSLFDGVGVAPQLDFVLPLACGTVTTPSTYDRIVDHELDLDYGHGHAVDLNAPLGTPALAPADGVISEVGIDSQGGWFLAIDHGGGWTTRSTHYEANSTDHLSVGDVVRQGAQIATVGSTGLSTGPHIHLELLLGGSEEIIRFDGEALAWGPGSDRFTERRDVYGHRTAPAMVSDTNCAPEEEDTYDPNPFIDVDRGAYYAVAVDWAFAVGVTTGTSSTMFSPDVPVTRWQMALFLQRLAGETDVDAPASGFTDLAGVSDSAVRAIDWLKETGITTGTSPTTYAPHETVTRWQMALFLQRLGDFLGLDAAGVIDDFTDTAHLNVATRSAIGWLGRNEITTGVGGGRFDPSGVVTRGQMVTFLFRLDQLFDEPS